MMSALGKREEILGSAQEREGKAGAPVPTAAGLPQPHASPGLPSQASATVCPHPRYCWGSGAREGHPQPPTHRSQCHHWPQETPPQPVACMACHVPIPHGSSPHAQAQADGAGVAAALVMLLLVPSKGVQEATSLIKLN